MPSVSLPDARAALVRGRILEGMSAVLAQGDAPTFANVARAAGVPERTLYRHFPTREALLSGMFDWANERLGFHGELPTSREEVSALVRRVFPGFDSLSPVIHELLVAPEGRTARLSNKGARQRAALAVVRDAAGALDRTAARHVAAVVQVLTTAAAWQALRDYWDMSGAEAAEASALAVELLLEGARARGKRRKSGARKSRTGAEATP
jgi:AcrR family transcriptional regulator